MREKAKHIAVELHGHLPFTLFGALLGIFFMLLFRRVGGTGGRMLFSVFHPGHVVLSAMVTASMFNVHAAKKRIILVVLVGYFGSVGVATLSDVIIPHVGTYLLGLDVPTHAVLHDDDKASPEQEEDEEDEHKIHLGFIEEWYIVNPAALLGIVIAYFLPRTKFPHAGHVLISTWASSSYMLMNMELGITAGVVAGMFVILFLAIWVPCCISDIVFPLLFVKSDIEMMGPCPVHGRHSHPHTDKGSEGHK
ncbi:MAG: hypothetical protein JSV99_04960 [Planctomycetota bacterium]|nr:MAG: hypothetical protein JSV99_04960 [Planctomycetota bacterium]